MTEIYWFRFWPNKPFIIGLIGNEIRALGLKRCQSKI